MKRLREIGEDASIRGGFLTIGNFDGVHLGHRAILAELCTRAHRHGVPAVVMTFEPPPAALLKPDSLPPRLTTPDQKARLLEQAGIDAVVEYPTNFPLLQLTPEQFFRQIILDGFDAKGLVEGPNFFFGRGRAGNVDTLRDLCQQAGRELEIVAPSRREGDIISSSAIRRLLSSGNVRQAAELLGRPYRVQGIVGTGAQRGRTLGFPTANLEQISTLLPADGIYAARCEVPSGRYVAAVNIGPNPTFADEHRKVEAHLLDFSGDLYGQPAALEFIDLIRSPRKFSSAAELQAQIQKDITTTRSAADGSGDSL